MSCRYAQVLLATALLGCGAPAAPSPPAATSSALDTGPIERELLAAENDVFAAIQRRDRAALESLTAEEFILRVPGAPDVDRAGFLAGIAAIPGEIVAVSGEKVAARSLGGDSGIVTGYQVARVRLDGSEIVDRQAFADVFERRDGRWRMVFAFGIAPATAPAPAAP
jgi:Domain of unknown function (DUF4440)